MEKRTVIVTGGNSGLGYQCAKNIAIDNKDYTLVLACRNPIKAKDAIKRMKDETGNQNIYSVALDLASLESIRDFADLYDAQEFPPLYAIVCNAGLNHSKLEYTKDGYEETFGVCHLGHYLLVNKMLQRMEDNGRVVFVASDMHRPPLVMSLKAPEFKDAYELAYPEKNGKPSRHNLSMRYPMAKLSNILCVYEMAERLKESGKKITVNAFNPGLMTDTNFMPPNTNKMAQALLIGASTLVAHVTGRYGSGKTSGVELAKMVTEKKYDSLTGKYIDRGTERNTSKPSYDKNAARKLWKQSAELVHLDNSETILSLR